MIDTVVLRIHNLEKYEQSINALVNVGKYGKTEYYGDEETGEALTVPKIQLLLHNNSGLNRIIRHRNKLFTPSSDYGVSYMVSHERNFVDVNLSLPKFLKGHNIYQFVDQFDQSCDRTYNLFMSTLKTYIVPFIFRLNKVDDRDVEINRVDFCFNQFFASKRDALKYLEDQKKVNIKYARSSKNSRIDYDTTLFYKTDRYTFKIYHKGAEFEKNDLDKLRKSKKDKNNLTQLFKESQKILRYEISFRNSYMNYVFNKLYREGTQRIDDTIYRYMFKMMHIDDKKNSEGGRKEFMLSSEFERWKKCKALYPDTWQKYYATRNTQCKFTIDIFRVLHSVFWQYVKKFQLETTVSENDVRKLFERSNKHVRIAHELSSMKAPQKNIERLLHWAVLSMTRSLRSYVKEGKLSNSQYYVILKEFKRVGLSDYNPSTRLVKPSTTYQQYLIFFGGLHTGTYI